MGISDFKETGNYYESLLVDFFAKKISETENIDLLLEMSSEVNFGFLQGLDFGLKIASKMFEQYRPFKLKIYYDIYDYFKRQLDDSPEEFISSFLPVGFNKTDQKHVEWAMKSLEQQVNEAQQNLEKLFQSMPVIIEEIKNLNLKDKIFNKLEELFRKLKQGVNLTSKKNEIDFEMSLNDFLNQLPKEFTSIIEGLIKTMLDGFSNKILRIPILDNIPKIYAESFDSIITHTLRPIILSKTNLVPTEVMRFTTYQLINQNRSTIPNQLQFILENLDPKIRNAVVHKNYIIDDENSQMSYFQPPFYNRITGWNSPLRFDRTQDLQELWWKSFILTITQLMISLMRQYYFVYKINDIVTEDHKLTYILWNPNSRMKGEFIAIISLIKAMLTQGTNDVDGKKTINPTIETAMMELIILNDKDILESRFIKLEGEKFKEKGINILFENLEVYGHENKDLIVAYFLYLIGNLEINTDIEKNITDLMNKINGDLDKFKKELNFAKTRSSSNIDIEKQIEEIEANMEKIFIELKSVQTTAEADIENTVKMKRIINSLKEIVKITHYDQGRPYASSIRVKSLLKGIRERKELK